MYEVVINKDVLEGMRDIVDESVDCIVTSPPYWALRDYQVEGQWGSEPTIKEYMSHLMALMTECRRVLKPTGSIWVNIGDTYHTYSGGSEYRGNSINVGTKQADAIKMKDYDATQQLKKKQGLTRKTMCGIPERFMIAMIDDQWTLRSKVIWHKRASMPESVKDRLARRYEPVYFFVKESKGYYFNLDAIRVPSKTKPAPFNIRVRDADKTSAQSKLGYYASEEEKEEYKHKNMRIGGQTPQGMHIARVEEWDDSHTKMARRREENTNVNFDTHNPKWDKRNPNGKNPGDILSLSPEPLPYDHFASFPTALPKFCISASCPPGGDVLDPFAGSGSTLVAAKQLGMSCTGIELNPEYIKIIKDRLSKTLAPLETHCK